jgi:hypothetical protein
MRPGEKVKLKKWPTKVKLFCRSKDGYVRVAAFLVVLSFIKG